MKRYTLFQLFRKSNFLLTERVSNYVGYLNPGPGIGRDPIGSGLLIFSVFI